VAKKELNAQNIPRIMRDHWGPVCTDGSTVLLQADKAQVEAVLTFAFASDYEGLQMVFDGVDLHAMLAHHSYGCEPTKAAAEALMVYHNGQMESARQASKPARHGWNYGMGPHKYSKQHGVSTKAAEKVFAALETLHPVTAQWRRDTEYEAFTRKMLDQGFGRIRRFMATATWLKAAEKQRPARGTGAAAYERWLKWTIQAGLMRWPDREKALAFRPASFAGDMWKIICSRLPVSGLPILSPETTTPLWTGTHDSFTLEVPKVQLAKYGRLLQREMTRPWPQLVVPKFYPKGFWTKIDLKWGETWAGEHKWEPLDIV